MPKHIIQQHKTYFAYLNVPKDVRHDVGKSAFKQTLKTSDLKEAELRAAILVSQWKTEINKARGKSTDWEYQALKIREEVLSAESPANVNGAFEVLLDTMADHFGITRKSDQAKLKRIIDTGLPSSYFLDDYIDRFETQYRKGVIEKTADQNVSALKTVAAAFNDIPLTDESVEAYIESLYEKYKKRTIVRRISAARQYFDFIIKQKDIPTGGLKNVFKDKVISPPKVAEKDKRRPFKNNEVVGLYDAACESDDFELSETILLGMFTGCRIEELFQIQTVGVADGFFQIEDAKTSAGIREVPIHPVIAPTVERLVKNSSDGYLLPSVSNNKYSIRCDAVGKRFGRLKKKKGYDGRYVFHSIRKTVTTQLEHAGVSESIAADIVGHEKPTMTYGLYSGGSSPQQKIEAVSRLEYPALQIKNGS